MRHKSTGLAISSARDRRNSLVFISHSSEDKPFVRRLASSLRGSGIRVWMDEGSIDPGDSIVEEIEKALAEATFFVVVISTNSISSAWVRRELNIALDRQLSGRAITVIPIKIDGTEMPVIISDIKAIDFSHNYDRALKDLLLRIGQVSQEVA